MDKIKGRKNNPATTRGGGVGTLTVAMAAAQIVELAEVRHKFDVLHRHCDAAARDYDTIETTLIQPWLLARDDGAVAVKRERLAALGPLRGFVGTVSEAIDLIGQY